jgi:nitroreductase
MGSNHSFIGNLEERRAVKHFGGGEVDSSSVLKAMVNAPTSFGLQPYTILVVKDKALKEKLRAVSYGQAQVTECDTLYILCARTDVEARAEEYLQTTKGEAMRGMLMGFVKGMPDKLAWAARQTYIALGFGLAAAAEERIASCPMEGFSTADVAKLLELPKTLVPVVYLAVGSDAPEDGTHPRFRFPESDLVKVY